MYKLVGCSRLVWLRRDLQFRAGMESASKRFSFTSRNGEVVLLGSDLHL